MREQSIMARHQRMPSQEAGYTYAVELTAIDRLLANEEESIYGHSNDNVGIRRMSLLGRKRQFKKTASMAALGKLQTFFAVLWTSASNKYPNFP